MINDVGGMNDTIRRLLLHWTYLKGPFIAFGPKVAIREFFKRKNSA